MELDLGGIAKEYAVDCASKVLQQSGVTSAMVNLAGDIDVIGQKGNLTPWAVGIVHPRNPQKSLGALAIHSGAIATSGDYQRYFELEGKRYHHLINPKTGWPETSFQSVSIIAENCLIAGASASIAMLLGENAGDEFLDDLNLPFIRVNQEGNIRSRLPEPLTISDEIPPK